MNRGYWSTKRRKQSGSEIAYPTSGPKQSTVGWGLGSFFVEPGNLPFPKSLIPGHRQRLVARGKRWNKNSTYPGLEARRELLRLIGAFETSRFLLSLRALTRDISREILFNVWQQLTTKVIKWRSHQYLYKIELRFFKKKNY